VIGNSKIAYSLDKTAFEKDEVLEIYKANNWSSADKPDLLLKALRNSDSVVTARAAGRLVGIGNAITDGYLVVYYSHLAVHPEFQGKGIGRGMMKLIQGKYKDFHQQVLVSEGDAVEFYKKIGFERAGRTEPLWIYQGDDHS